MLKNRNTILIFLILAIGLSACGTQTTSDALPSTDVAEPEASTEAISHTGTDVSYAVSYPLVDTAQGTCYDASELIDCPAAGEAFYGQDAQYTGNEPSYTDNGDGTITDNVTGLVWTQDLSDASMPWSEAAGYCESLTVGSVTDWRLPNIKELWSIRDFSTGWPWVDTDYFYLVGDGSQGAQQHSWSSNYYLVDTEEAVENVAFIVNDWTGHIKALDGNRFVRCVSGDEYGINDFVDNGDPSAGSGQAGTITDNATGLMWAQDDSGEAMGWEAALAYAEASTYAGYDDWRLPNVKELQSIADYSGVFPAIDSTMFNVSGITNEAGNADYPYYWTSTSNPYIDPNDEDGYWYAWYVAAGYAVDTDGNDTHGAGAVRFDTKSEDGASGPDGERYYNYVRLVRGGEVVETLDGDPSAYRTDRVVVFPDGDTGDVGNGAGGPGGGAGGPPDFAGAAAQLGVTEEALIAALGDPNQGETDFEAAAATLGVTAEELEAALMTGGGAPEGGAPTDGAEIPAPVIVGDGIENVGDGRLFAIPGDNVFPEGVSYDPTTGKFYVGATTDGTLYVGDVNGSNEMTLFSEGGADGRTAAIGTKVDSDGNLWVAGGNTGQVFVYDTDDASLVANFTTPEADATFINDLAITESSVYFTDSFRPILWRASGVAGGEAEAWLDFTGTAINYVDGFNLNGIAATADGDDLIAVHSGEGALYHINIETQEVTRIDTDDVELTAGDGLALVGSTLYVTRNSFGEIVPLELSADFSTATGGTPITSDLFGYPTTIAYTGNSLLVANSQFNNRSGTPNLPFTVAQIPLAQNEEARQMEEPAPVTFKLDAWADNWFTAYLDETLIVEDSVSIDTERSFNAETATFEASYPFNLNFILKDFKENDTGLEYISERNQQMGDGGFIMQLTDTSTGEVVAVSDSSFACLVIHEAPLDKSCENEANPVAGIAPCEFVDLGEPEGWKAAEYDDSAWTATTVHSAAAVGPKGGYDDVTWNEAAEFIWGPDLETNNTLLCRVTISKE